MKTFVAVVGVALVGALSMTCTQTGQQTVSLVVTHGVLITMDGGGRVIADGAVAIDGADIVAVDTAEAVGFAAPRQLMLPDR